MYGSNHGRSDFLNHLCCRTNAWNLQNGDAVYNVLYAPYHFTMDLLSLWIVLIMAYNYGKALGLKSPIMTSVQTAVCFALIACTWGNK